MKLQTLYLDHIRRDRRFQMRSREDTRTAARFALAMKQEVKFPPPVIAKVDGVPCVVDGFHRLKAAESLGLEKIECEVHEGVTQEEALGMAMRANLKHGLQLKKPDLRNVFKAYMMIKAYLDQHDRPKSFREIAKELEGVISYGTVRTWMMKDFLRIYRKHYSGDDETQRATGGHRGMQINWSQDIRATITEAMAAAPATMDPDVRGDLVEAARGLVNALEKGGPWTPSWDRF